MLKNDNFLFLFSRMWLYPVLFSIISRLQKCNFFACTHRMNNSNVLWQLSQRTKREIERERESENEYFLVMHNYEIIDR